MQPCEHSACSVIHKTYPVNPPQTELKTIKHTFTGTIYTLDEVWEPDYVWFGSVCKWNGACLSIEHECRLVYLQILSELKQCRLPWIQEPLSAEDQQGRQSKGRGREKFEFQYEGGDVGREEEFMVWIWGRLFWAIALLILDPEPPRKDYYMT